VEEVPSDRGHKTSGKCSKGGGRKKSSPSGGGGSKGMQMVSQQCLPSGEE